MTTSAEWQVWRISPFLDYWRPLDGRASARMSAGERRRVVGTPAMERRFAATCSTLDSSHRHGPVVSPSVVADASVVTDAVVSTASVAITSMAITSVVIRGRHRLRGDGAGH
jgi:hypothetical protein